MVVLRAMVKSSPLGMHTEITSISYDNFAFYRQIN